MKAGLIRPEPLHHLGDSPGRPALACQAVDRQASTGRQLLPNVSSTKGYLLPTAADGSARWLSLSRRRPLLVADDTPITCPSKGEYN